MMIKEAESASIIQVSNVHKSNDEVNNVIIRGIKCEN